MSKECDTCAHWWREPKRRGDAFAYGACTSLQGREREAVDAPIVVAFARCKNWKGSAR